MNGKEFSFLGDDARAEKIEVVYRYLGNDDVEFTECIAPYPPCQEKKCMNGKRRYGQHPAVYPHA